ncbi:MAG: alpha/beta fold hydrolase [Pseudomonadales bacterium]
MFDDSARERGLTLGEVTAGAFALRTFTTTHNGEPSPRLHIYLDGDGRPFVTPRRIARDPTPQAPLVLDLMVSDPQPAIYLGRPCYHGLQTGCDARDWTIARYGPRVVDALALAVRRTAARHQAREVVLIGYSGGGVLAVLVADRVPEVSAVLTVAANLDTDAWTNAHGFSALEGSLNPAELKRVSPAPALHLSGAEDQNVPPELIERYRAAAPDAVFATVAGFGHVCCWARDWAHWLARLDAITFPRTERARRSTDPAPHPAGPDASPGNRRSP